jgi:hypothetical protein
MSISSTSMNSTRGRGQAIAVAEVRQAGKSMPHVSGTTKGSVISIAAGHRPFRSCGGARIRTWEGEAGRFTVPRRSRSGQCADQPKPSCQPGHHCHSSTCRPGWTRTAQPLDGGRLVANCPWSPSAPWSVESSELVRRLGSRPRRHGGESGARGINGEQVVPLACSPARRRDSSW